MRLGDQLLERLNNLSTLRLAITVSEVLRLPDGYRSRQLADEGIDPPITRRRSEIAHVGGVQRGDLLNALFEQCPGALNRPGPIPEIAEVDPATGLIHPEID